MGAPPQAPQEAAESLRGPVPKVYRRFVAAGTMTRRAVFVGGLLASLLGCTSIDPGSSLVVPITSFDSDYFYCHVEPQYIFGAAYKCGSGQAGDNNSCHFSSAVPGMGCSTTRPSTAGAAIIPSTCHSSAAEAPR